MQPTETILEPPRDTDEAAQDGPRDAAPDSDDVAPSVVGAELAGEEPTPDREAPAEEVEAPVRTGPRRRFGPWVLLGIAIASLVAAGMAESRNDDAWAFFMLLGLGAAGWGLARGLAMLVDTKLDAEHAVLVIGGCVVNLVIVLCEIGRLQTLWIIHSGRLGRQLRRAGRVLLPPVVPSPSWSGVKVAVEGPGSSARALACQWREIGRTEHASVAAFARLTMELMALGAPRALVAAASRDARDEIRHTELCFSVARALDGGDQGPGAFPEVRRALALPRWRTLALAQLAADSLVDGALHEGVSARVVSRLARRCEVPAVRGVLRELAADEARHAADAWDVVAWCLQAGGPPVAGALARAARRIPADLPSAMMPESRDGSWERWGIQGAELEKSEYTATRERLQRRVRELTTRS